MSPGSYNRVGSYGLDRTSYRAPKYRIPPSGSYGLATLFWRAGTAVFKLPGLTSATPLIQCPYCLGGVR